MAAHRRNAGAIPRASVPRSYKKTIAGAWGPSRSPVGCRGKAPCIRTPFNLLKKQLQGPGDRHGPQWGAGAKPLHVTGALSPKPICAANGRSAPKTPRRGTPGGRQPDRELAKLGMAWQKNRSWPCVKQKAEKPQVLVSYSSIFHDITVRVGLPPSQGRPCGAVLGALRTFSAKMCFGKTRNSAGALPLHPTGDRDGPRTPAIP